MTRRRGGRRRAWLVAVAAASVVASAASVAAAPDGALQDEFAADVAEFQPVVEEASRVHACVEAEMARRGLDMDSVMDVLDAAPDAVALRANLVRLLEQDVALTADDRRTLETDTRLRVPFLGYQVKGAATFDLGVIARAIAVQSVYLDRALGSRCGPRPELLTFIGVTPRAD